jgi:hypothetical protein
MEKDTLREFLFKEVELTQDIINRMGSNSFLIKGFAITIVAASLLFSEVSYYHFVALLPWLMFWYLDTYFLRLEKLYRKLYDWLIANRLKSEEFLLDMNSKNLEKRFGKESFSSVMFSKTLLAFYGLLFIIIISTVVADLIL